MTTEVLLAEAHPASGRRWNPLDITDSCAVDTAGIGPLTLGQGDSDRSGLHASRVDCPPVAGRAEMKPTADRIRSTPPFGSPKPEG